MGVEWPGPGSFHPGGSQFCLADASTRFVSETMATGNPFGDAYGRNGNIWSGAHCIKGIPEKTPVVWP
jgi:hypothetical protein